MDLESPDWNSIASSSGESGGLVAQLLRKAELGDETVYPELHHQLCHQFTVAAVAYVAVPHLVRIARKAAFPQRVWPLSIVGGVVAGRAAFSMSAASLSEEWRTEYVEAIQDALHLSAETLGQPGLSLSGAQELIATVAACHGLIDLAIHLFSQGGSTELSCAVCGEGIQFTDD